MYIVSTIFSTNKYAKLGMDLFQTTLAILRLIYPLASLHYYVIDVQLLYIHVYSINNFFNEQICKTWYGFICENMI